MEAPAVARAEKVVGPPQVHLSALQLNLSSATFRQS